MSGNSIDIGSTNMHENIESYTCTHCGGKLVLNDDEPIVYCENCGKAYVSSSLDGLERYYSPSAFSNEEIWKKVKVWFSRGAKDLVDCAQLVEIKTLYLPVWRTVTETRTVACGFTTHKDSKGRETVEYIKRLYKRDFIWDDFACDGSEYGISSYEIGKSLKPLFEAEEELPLVPVIYSETDAKERSRVDVAESAKNDALSDMEKWTFYHVFPILKSFKIIYLPYAIVRYTYNGSEYSVTVNASSGRIEAGTMPSDKNKQALGFGVQLGIGAALIGFGGGFLIAQIILGNPVLGVILGVIMALIGYFGLYKSSIKRLQYGRTIKIGTRITEKITALKEVKK